MLVDKYPLRGLHSAQLPAPEPGYTRIQVETKQDFPRDQLFLMGHAEEHGGSPVHTEHWSESHIADVSDYLQSHSPPIHPLSFWFDLFTNTTSRAWAQPCWNHCCALAGCWGITVQSKAHQNRHMDSRGLTGALRGLLNIWPSFPSAASSRSKAAQWNWFGNHS